MFFGKIDKFEEIEITIIDMSGRTVWHETRTGLLHSINVSSFKRGMYLLEVFSKDQQQDFKFIKQ